MTANTPDLPHIEGMSFTNTDTGITYKYINGAWRAVNSGVATDIIDRIDGIEAAPDIWFGEDAPEDEKYDFWFDTVRLELLVKYEEQWWPVSLPASQLEDLRKVLETELQGVFEETSRIENEAFQAVRDLRYSLNLEQVLENGPVADQGIILRAPDALESDADAIILAPTISRITLAAEQKENFLPTFQLIEKGDTADQNRTAEFELDDGRLDINMTEQLDEVHFRFRDEEELILRHRSNPAGPSELFGKLKVDPGTEGNEVVTYSQLQSVSGEIDEIKIEKERGKWTATNPPHGSGGETVVLIDDPNAGSVDPDYIEIDQKGGGSGAGTVNFVLADSSTADLRAVLTQLADECFNDEDGFKNKYTFFCPWAEDEGLAVREQPIKSLVASSLTTYEIKYVGPSAKEDMNKRGVGIKIYIDSDDVDLPEIGDFYMESFENREAERQQCQDVYTQCAIDNAMDPTALTECNRVYSECVAANNDGFHPTLDFGVATRLVFNKTDSSSTTHTFDDVEPGDSIRIMDEESGAFMISEIESIQGKDDYIRFAVNNLSHSGVARVSKKCKIEFYRFQEDTVDLDDYVKKSGDTMTGDLFVTGGRVKINGYTSNNQTLFQVHPGSAESETSRIFKVQDVDKNDLLTVRNDGSISAKDGWHPHSDRHLTTKKWIEDNFMKVPGGFKIVKEGDFYYLED